MFNLALTEAEIRLLRGHIAADLDGGQFAESEEAPELAESILKKIDATDLD